MSANHHYVRSWCSVCHALTDWRREGSRDDMTSRVECAWHTLPERRIDWVDVAIRAARHAD